MKKLLSAAALFSLCAFLAFAGTDATHSHAVRTTRDITLDDAVAIALRQNPDILRALQEIQRTRGLIIEVRAQALPNIGVGSTYSQQDRRLIESGGGGGLGGNRGSAVNAAALQEALSQALTTNGTPGAVDSAAIEGALQSALATPSQSAATDGGGGNNKSWQITIEGRQLLYSGGQVRAAMRIARFSEDSAYWSLRDTVDNVISTVRKQFYLVLLNRALINVQEENIRLLESQLGDQQNRFEAGTVPRFNVLQAEVALANARPALIRARNNYNISELQLARILGIPYESAPVGVPPINPIGSLNTTEQPLPLAEALDLAKLQRPFLKVQRQQILIGAEQIKVELAAYQPRLEASGGYIFRNSRLSEELDDVVNGWFFGFIGSWDIFDGFATYGRTKQAKARLEQSRITYIDSVQQVELEVQQALASVNEARQTIASQAKAVEQAEEAVRLSRERLSAGAGTQLDVLNAQVALTQARSTALQARADYNVAMAEFDRVTSRSTRYDDTFQDPLSRRQQRAMAREEKKRQRQELRERSSRPAPQPQPQAVRTSPPTPGLAK